MVLGQWAASSIVEISILIGAAALMMLDHVVPHEHFIKGCERSEHAGRLRRVSSGLVICF